MNVRILTVCLCIALAVSDTILSVLVLVCTFFTLSAVLMACSNPPSYEGSGGSTSTTINSGPPYTVTYANTTPATTGHVLIDSDGGGGGTFYARGATFTITSNVTLYGEWTP